MYFWHSYLGVISLLSNRSNITKTSNLNSIQIELPTIQYVLTHLTSCTCRRGLHDLWCTGTAVDQGSDVTPSVWKPGRTSQSTQLTMPPKYKFSEGEKVLCFHGPLLYEAKVWTIPVQTWRVCIKRNLRSLPWLVHGLVSRHSLTDNLLVVCIW